RQGNRLRNRYEGDEPHQSRRLQQSVARHRAGGELGNKGKAVRGPLFSSLLLHAAVLGWALFTIQTQPELRMPEPEPIAGDLISAGDLTKLRQGVRTAKELEAEAKPTPKPDSAKKEAPKPTPVAAAPAPPEPPTPPAPKEEVKPPEPKSEPVAPPPAPAPAREEQERLEAMLKEQEQERLAEEQKKQEEARRAEEL